MRSTLVRSRAASVALSLTTLVTLADCGSDGGGSPTSAATRRLNVSFAVTVPASAAVVTAGTAADAHALVITRAQLVLARVELQRVGATCTSTEAAGDDDVTPDSEHCAELELAPTLVELPVSGGVSSTLTVDVPEGRYASLEAKIAPVAARNGSGHHGSAAFLAAHPDLAGVSVRVEGTFDGRPFVYVGAPRAHLETVFDPALAVASGGANLTIGVELTGWFRGADGSPLDPATALAGGPNAVLVAGNIVRSFSAFRDEDRDGRDDHGGRDRSSSGADDDRDDHDAGDDRGGDG